MEFHMHSHHFVRPRPDWRAAALAGVAAGVIFLILEMAATAILGGSLWAPLRMTAAIVLGHNILPQPSTFETGIMLAALVVHFALSVIFGLILAAIMASFSLDSSVSMASLAGLIFGLLVYWFDFHAMTSVFPWFVDASGAASLVTHLVFGLVVADTYRQFKGKLVTSGNTTSTR